ncbi:MAG: DUF2062 domain-containing protein [Cyanobacteria bacterium P01_D01_bin.44]
MSNPSPDPRRPIVLKKSQAPWRRRLRYLYIRFLRLRSHPREIARGLAAGVFAGSFPLFGLQTIMGVAIAAVIRGNKIVAAAGTWISNPFTYVPIYAFNFKVGQWLLRQPIETSLFKDEQSLKNMMALGADITITLFTGSALVGLVLSIISYYLGLTLTKRIHHARLKRKARKYLQ